MAADNMYWCTCGLYNTFLTSVFSEYWCSTVMFSLLRDLDLGNLFIYLF